MALKLHLRGITPSDRVELHGFPGGYAGLCSVEGDRVNLCLLTEAAAFRAAGGDYQRFARQTLGRNPRLEARLEELGCPWREVLAAGNLTFGPARWTEGGVVPLGDAAGTIAPLCGDGMAMALRAAEILSPLADAFLTGSVSGKAMLQAYQRQWRAEFWLRLRLGRMLQGFFLRPGWSQRAVSLLRTFPRLGQALLSATRGTVDPPQGCSPAPLPF